MTEFRICIIPGCGKSARVGRGERGYCRSHFRRLRLYGDPYARKTRTVFQPNLNVQLIKDMTSAPGQDCIIWTGQKDKAGYGRIEVRRKKVSAHRLSYEINKGSAVGQVVRHTCDTPACINPNHLVLGTQVENVRDSIQRDRNAKGTTMPHAKLDDDKVKQIRQSPLSEAKLAKIFGVAPSTIHMVRSRRAWKHIT